MTIFLFLSMLRFPAARLARASLAAASLSAVSSSIKTVALRSREFFMTLVMIVSQGTRPDARFKIFRFPDGQTAKT